MRILVIGGSGTLGREVVAALHKDHEVVVVTRKSAPLAVDISDRGSILSMYRQAGPLDAVVSAAGQAKFAPLAALTDDDFAFSLANKLMGQVNLVRLGFETMRDGGSFTITSGVLAQQPMPGSAAISLVNAGLEGFARAAALEAPRGIRVNAVSPPWATETLRAFGMDESLGLPAATLAKAYVASVLGKVTGAVIPGGA